MRFITRTGNKSLKIAAVMLASIALIGVVATPSHAGSWNGWIYQDSYPTSQDLYDVKFVTPLKGWMVGRYGGIFFTADGGNTWEAQESGTGENLARVAFVNENSGWVTGKEGSILHTGNGGKTLVKQYDADAPLAKVFFLNEKEGWVAGSTTTGVLYRTRDGGKTWEKIETGGNRAIASVYFVNARTGWMLAGEDVYRTTDGGAKWERTKLPIGKLPQRRQPRVPYALFGDPDAPPPNTTTPVEDEGLGRDWKSGDITFVNEMQGWAAVFQWLFHTQDGGKTWTMQLDTANLEHGLVRISFRDSLNGCAVGWTIYCTEDGGNTWQDRLGSGKHDDNMLGGVSLTGSSDGWAVGSMGRTFKTADSGRSWMRPSGDNCGSELFFVNNKTGWRYGPLGFNELCRTDDGGHTWEKKEVGMQAWNVFFVNDSTGWAVGIIGETKDGKQTGAFPDELVNLWSVIKHTVNGGKTWTTQYKGSMHKDRHPGFSGVFFANPAIGWVVGENGTVLHTKDGGKHWERQQSGTTLHLRNVYFGDAKTGVAIGDRQVALGAENDEDKKAKGVVLYTADGGKQWRVTWEGAPVLMSDLFFLDKKKAWVTVKTLNGISLLHSGDGGEKWVEKTKLDRIASDSATPFFLDEERGVLYLQRFDHYGTEETILKTDNGGKTWTKVRMPLKKYPWHFSELFEKVSGNAK